MGNHGSRFFGTVLVILFSVISFSANLHAQKQFEGWWESETVTKSSTVMGSTSDIKHSKTFYKSKKMKEVDLDENIVEIYRLDKGLVWTLNPERKIYFEVRFEDIDKQMKQIQQQMAEKMEQLDPQQRQMMQEMLGEKFNAMFDRSSMQASFKVTGKTKNINGYKCKQVIMLLNKSPLMEMWLTDRYNLGNDFIEYYEKSGLVKGKISNAKELSGFPIYTKMETTTKLGNSVEETTVKKIVQTKIVDKEFEIPAGYKKVTEEMFYEQ